MSDELSANPVPEQEFDKNLSFSWRRDLSFFQKKAGTVHRTRQLFEVPEQELLDRLPPPAFKRKTIGNFQELVELQQRQQQETAGSRRGSLSSVRATQDSIRKAEERMHMQIQSMEDKWELERAEFLEKINFLEERHRQDEETWEEEKERERSHFASAAAEWEEKRTHLEESNHLLTSSIHNLTEQNKYLEESSHNMDLEKEKWERKMKELEEENKKVQGVINDLVVKAAGKDSANKELEDVLQINQSLTNQNQDLKLQLQTAMEKLAEVKKSLSETERRNKEEKKKAKEVKTTTEQLKKELVQVTDKYNQLNSEWLKKETAWKAKTRKLVSEVESTKKQHELFETDRDQLRKEKKEFEVDLLTINTSLNVPAAAHDPKSMTAEEIAAASQELTKRNLKITVIQKYLAQERERFALTKKSIEEYQLQCEEMKKDFSREIEEEREKLRVEKERFERMKEKSKDSSELKKSTSFKKSGREAPSTSSSPTTVTPIASSPLSLNTTAKSKKTLPKSASSERNTKTSRSKVRDGVSSPSLSSNPSSPKSSRKVTKTRQSQQTLPQTADSQHSHGHSHSAPKLKSFLESEADPFALEPPLVYELLHSEDRSAIVFSEENEVLEGNPLALLLHIGASPEFGDFASDFFIISSYFFSSPVHVLRGMMLAYASNEFTPRYFSLGSEEVGMDSRVVYKERLCQALQGWVQMSIEVLTICPEFLVSYKVFQTKVSTVHAEALESTWEKVVSQWEEFKTFTATIKIKTGIGCPLPTLALLQISPAHMASQLTLWEQGRMQSVGIKELYNKAWLTPGAAPALSAWIEDSEVMSTWIASTITAPNQSPQQSRKMTIALWVHTLEALFTLNNFNSMMQIISAFNLQAVQQLEDFQKSPASIHALLTDFITRLSATTDFKGYRVLLDDTIVKEQPCIPYMSLMLKDLLHLEKTPAVQHGLCNFRKLSFMASLFDRIQSLMLILYDIPEDVAVQQHLFHKLIPEEPTLSSTDPTTTNKRASLKPTPSNPSPPHPTPTPPESHTQPTTTTATTPNTTTSPPPATTTTTTTVTEQAQPSSTATEGTASKENGTTSEAVYEDFSPDLVTCLTRPEHLEQFKAWLLPRSEKHANTLECMLKMIIFSRQPPTPDSKKLAKEIWKIYLTPTSVKGVGTVAKDILNEIEDIIFSDSLIPTTLFDELGEGCYEALDEVYPQFAAYQQTTNKKK